MPPDSVLDSLGLPLPAVKRSRLASSKACEVHEHDVELAALVGSLRGPKAASVVIGVHRSALYQWLSGTQPIALRHIDRLIELARQQSLALAELAVRLETLDRPVLRERRRQSIARSRVLFRERFGFYPEENQTMRRQREQRPPA